jgi:hypothetical protein
MNIYQNISHICVSASSRLSCTVRRLSALKEAESNKAIRKTSQPNKSGEFV